MCRCFWVVKKDSFALLEFHCWNRRTIFTHTHHSRVTTVQQERGAPSFPGHDCGAGLFLIASDLNSVPSRNKEKIIKGNCETWRGTWTHTHLPNRSDHKTIHGKSKLDSLLYCIHQFKGKYCFRLPCHSPKNYLLQNEPLGSLVKFTVIGDSEERWRLPTVWRITSFI